ncbi:MAG: UDP-glucose/GDP-mannose dehydrogenase family protein [Nitrososphaerales archaeon]|nr:UDP-glucose/GDP-mannose dehydrogenase family protein [Nitrososphaerales archaeon]
MDKGTLRTTCDPDEAVLSSDVTFITVGTPNKEDGSIDLKYVLEASNMIGKALRRKNEWHLIVVKSTVVPRTIENFVRKAIEEASGKVAFKGFGLAVNPEFLKEGSAIEDFMKPDRIVIGANDEKSMRVLEEIYSSFDCPKLATNINTAELMKYANNAFLAMKVSFINMMGNLCEKLPGTDVEVIAKGIGFDCRIGPLFLRAGAGWGGSCWPKDLKALANFGKNTNVRLPLIEATLEINENQPYRVIELAEELLNSLKLRKISVLGLAFKPNTDDIREAVSIKIVKALLDRGAKVSVYDPAAIKNVRQIFDNRISYANSALECIKDSECAMIITEWDEFRELKPEDYARLMKRPILIDGRRIYNTKEYTRYVKIKAIGLGETCPSN